MFGGMYVVQFGSTPRGTYRSVIAGDRLAVTSLAVVFENSGVPFKVMRDNGTYLLPGSLGISSELYQWKDKSYDWF